MIRVGVVSTGLPYEHGGAELRALRHVQYLRRQPDLDAILIAWNQQERDDFAINVPEYVHPVRVVPEKKEGHFLALWHIIKVLLHLGRQMFLLRGEIDLVHIIFAFSWFNLLAVVFAKWLGKPVILEMTALGTDDPLSLNRRAGRRDKQIFPHQSLKYQLFKRADMYISKSTPLSKAYLESGLPKARLCQIASAVDTNVFTPVVDPAEKFILRRKLGLETLPLTIVYSGRLNEYKGLHWLIEAMEKVVSINLDVKLLIVGAAMRMDEAYAKQLQASAVLMGLSERILFTGRVDNVHEYLQASDIFAIPTRREGLSGSILEAMACGLPIVASDIPEISLSQVTDKIDGLLVPVGDVERLSDALILLLRNRGLRESLGRSARQRILREFTPEIVGAKYINLYQRLISEAKYTFKN